jgi:DMSO/TMAO reductase YedYZ molybdopterin-dependent catalytic subunit
VGVSTVAPRRWAAALSGAVSAGVGLGVGQLVGGFTGPAAAPVAELGRLPGAAAPSLVIALLVLLAAGLGVLSTRRGWAGPAGLTMIGAVGLGVAATGPAFTAAGLLPILGGAVAAAGTLAALLRALPPVQEPAAAPARAGGAGGDGELPWWFASRPPPREPAPEAEPPPEPGLPRQAAAVAGLPRRRFLTLSATAAGAAATAGLSGRLLAERFQVAADRTALRLPPPVRRLPPLAAGVDLGVPGLGPFVTPNGGFYRVDTAFVLPQIDPRSWRLRIHGMVDRELTLSFAELLREPLLEDYVTLCCVSNPVGGPYIGNARWLGASLGRLLRRAGVRAGAQQLLCTSADGFTCGTPVPAVLDDRDALLAVGMNGSPLPVAHGFPVRMVVPGLYGYVSATKWLTDIKVTTYAAEPAYWVQRGWAQRAPVKTESRIDVPALGRVLRPGPAPIAGVAWAQHRGIDAVEVRVDRGPWQPARLGAVPGVDTWRQWVHEWHATPGGHVIEARATDATGYTQTAAPTPPVPDGATGYPVVRVTVRAE